MSNRPHRSRHDARQQARWDEGRETRYGFYMVVGSAAFLAVIIIVGIVVYVATIA